MENKCPYCGSSIPIGSTTCPTCGAALEIKSNSTVRFNSYPMGNARSLSRIVYLPKKKIFELFLNELRSGKYFVRAIDTSNYMIAFKTKACFSDWGFKYNLVFSDINDSQTKISYSSAPVFGFDLFNVGEKKLVKILNGLR